jgi:hypothetical protein
MINIRRGEGNVDDLLLADLLITTPEGLQAIEDDQTEVSLGYDAHYTQLSPGKLRQSDIIINHLALVEKGRCGPRCTIGDHQPVLIEGRTMAGKTKDNRVANLLRRAFKAKDSDEVENLIREANDEMGTELEGGEGGETHIHIHAHPEGGEGATPAAVVPEKPSVGDEGGEGGAPDLKQFMEENARDHEEFRTRIAALEKALSERATGDQEGGEEKPKEDEEEAMRDEAPEGLEEEATKSKDSAYYSESFRETIAQAEILAPGIGIPTFDRKAKPLDTVKTLCNFRRKVLDHAYTTDEGRQVIGKVLGGRTLDTAKMNCGDVRALFRSAAALRETINRSHQTNDSKMPGTTTVTQPQHPTTPAALNARLREHYNRQ